MDENGFTPDRIAEAGAFSADARFAAADRVLDITREVCPMTFVRTRLALDRLATGQTLLVLLRGAEPRARVPVTAAQLGHAILGIEDLPDGTARVLIRRA
jgi:TusA-related sulfurtransferase